jgi:hypothetical protein
VYITLREPRVREGKAIEIVPGVLRGVSAWGVHSDEGDTSLTPTFYPWSAAVRRIALRGQVEEA